MSDDTTPQANEDEEETGGDGNVGPAEDIENDPAHEPPEENLKHLKGG